MRGDECQAGRLSKLKKKDSKGAEREEAGASVGQRGRVLPRAEAAREDKRGRV